MDSDQFSGGYNENKMDQRKKVLILTADTGFGHRSAANAVAEALQETRGERVAIEIANPFDDERTPAFLRESQEDYDKMVREMPDYYKLRYDFSTVPVTNAIVDRALTVLMYNVMRDYILRSKPHVIINTFPMYCAAAAAVIAVNKLNIPLLTVITDLVDVHIQWLHEGADLTCVSTASVYEQGLKAGLLPEQIQVTGIPVSPKVIREKHSAQEIRKELGWRTDLTTILVVGSKRVNNLYDVLQVLDHSGWPIQFALVAGGDEGLFEAFKRTDWHHPVSIYNYVDNLPSMMHASDLVISKAGGLIVTESLACGLPILFVDVTPGQEMGNAEYVIENRVGEWAKDPLEALEILFHWLDHNQAQLKEYRERAKKAGRPMAAYTVADLAWAAAERGPLPRPSSHAPVLPKLIDLLSSFEISGDGDEANDDVRPASVD